MKENYKFIHHVLNRANDSMIHLLQKGSDFQKEKGASVDVLNARLAPDMFPFVKQVQLFTDNVAGAIARSAGLPKPSMPDTETTFEELIARAEKTKEFIKSINPDTVEGIENLKVKLPWFPEGVHFDAHTYLFDFSIQNSMFHLVTAYGILRHLGATIGKPDYIGQLKFTND